MSSIFSILARVYPLLLKGLFMTMKISAISLSFGFMFGLVLGILNNKVLKHKLFGKLIDGFVWIIRGSPLFIQVLIIYYALPDIIHLHLSPFSAGVIALSINSAAYVSEIIKGSIDAIPIGQWEAAYSLGMNRSITLQKIIVPQAIKISAPSLINELFSLIKETSILMTIGVTELTKVSKDIVTRELDPMTIYLTTAVLYLLLTCSVSALVKIIQKRVSSS